MLTSPSNFSKREHAAVKYGSRFAPSHGSVDKRQEKPMKEGRRWYTTEEVRCARERRARAASGTAEGDDAGHRVPTALSSTPQQCFNNT